MNKIRILDCTLRDGGRIIDCSFQNREIMEISHRLVDAKIDIVEVGFIRDRRKKIYQGNSTFFTDTDQIRPYVKKGNYGTIFAAFIDYGMCDIDSLKPYDGTSIDAIRFGFTKKNYDEECDEVIRWAKVIKKKGYKLFIQGVNSLNYTDLELLEVVRMTNDIHPYSFGIVDTYGAMYIEDIDRLYTLIDHNLDENICINFHSHNNYQLSFALAQEVLKLRGFSNRKIILDGTLFGMGKVAGNLNTELIADYLVRKKKYDYNMDIIFDLIDNHIQKYSVTHKWGYSVASLMAGIYKSHPNNVIYFTEKFRLDSKDIGRLLSLIPNEKRQRYDYDMLERIYQEYSGENIDDTETIDQIKQLLFNKEILLLVPGKSINDYKDKIDEFVLKKKPVVISVNYISSYDNSYAFYGNHKRYSQIKDRNESCKLIITSNIKSDNKNDMVVNYYSLVNHGSEVFDNSVIMLLNMIKNMNPLMVYFAGFDGFDKYADNNFINESFQNELRDQRKFEKTNIQIAHRIKDYIESIDEAFGIAFLTPSKYMEFLDKWNIKYRKLF